MLLSEDDIPEHFKVGDRVECIIGRGDTDGECWDGWILTDPQRFRGRESGDIIWTVLVGGYDGKQRNLNVNTLEVAHDNANELRIPRIPDDLNIDR